jgi:hypothetical protein
VETPRVLLQLEVDHLAKGLLRILQHLTTRRIAGSRLKYTLIAIAGLLRVREFDPWALLSDRSPLAASLVQIMEEATEYLRQTGSISSINSINEIVKMLQGVGGRPDILLILEEIED